MKLNSLCLFFTLSLFHRVFTISQIVEETNHALTPPRGWNSYDSFCWTISEEEFLQNAALVKKLLHSSGYEYVVVDYLWYRRHVDGAYVDSLGFDVIDEWGRMIPDPGRWPSSRDGRGFTEVAKIVHNMGLKFGIHIMRGISTQAVNANTPILDITTGKAYEESGRKWYAKDIGMTERACKWMRNGFMSVDTKSGAGRAFLRSLYHQYADWGVDFVKHDCVFGDDLDVDEISVASEFWREHKRPIIYSLSPGTGVTPTMAKEINDLVNMYRVTGDDWDSWQDVTSHFDISRDFAAARMTGTKGLSGKSWPDLDMLPLGWLTDPGVNHGPYRNCKLSLNERKTQMTLWAMARSPLMFGGDMRNLDKSTLNLIAHPVLMEINSFSSDNKQFPYITSSSRFQIKNRGLNFQTRSLKNVGRSESIDLRLTSCKVGSAKGWFTRSVDNESEQVCWTRNFGSKYQAPFCLNKGGVLSASDEEMTFKQKYEHSFHLFSANTKDFCLSASQNRRLTSKEVPRVSFSPCRRHTNQLWGFNDNGTLVSSYSGLCASMYRIEGNAVPMGIRSWISSGTKGKIYLAFFNLNHDETIISVKMSDLLKGLPYQNSNISSCAGTEIWGGKDYGVIKDTLSIAVEMHGCALFVLRCT
ncbi:Alpha-galactosidase [Heracleum sosnowskyi]|uniref:Alpha-galactosidase n=1 Tax=Heracleum sosnowskyi TaxID=360622 RepID=A0AAD8JFZ2_9APIA|nr:Alpha-galactosidase [Heracleum sosnowskyi]